MSARRTSAPVGPSVPAVPIDMCDGEWGQWLYERMDPQEDRPIERVIATPWRSVEVHVVTTYRLGPNDRVRIERRIVSQRPPSTSTRYQVSQHSAGE